MAGTGLFHRNDRARISPLAREYKSKHKSTRTKTKVQERKSKYKRKIVSSTAGSPIVFLLTTLGGDADAAAFARALVEEKLAACVSVLPPMTSVYRWKETIEQEHEQQLMIKTTMARIDAIADRFRTLHPYELPEFVVLQPVDVSRAYGEWITEMVNGE